MLPIYASCILAFLKGTWVNISFRNIGQITARLSTYISWQIEIQYLQVKTFSKSVTFGFLNLKISDAPIFLIGTIGIIGRSGVSKPGTLLKGYPALVQVGTCANWLATPFPGNSFQSASSCRHGVFSKAEVVMKLIRTHGLCPNVFLSHLNLGLTFVVIWLPVFGALFGVQGKWGDLKQKTVLYLYIIISKYCVPWWIFIIIMYLPISGFLSRYQSHPYNSDLIPINISFL